MFELCGITTASQPSLLRQSRSSACHSASLVGSSSAFAGRAGATLLRKITFRCRLRAPSPDFVHS